MAPVTVLISGLGIAGPALAYWLARAGHRPILVERTQGLRVGGHAVDIRGTALEVIERMNGFRPNVEENQRLATHGMAVLLPASRSGDLRRATRRCG